jgi:hypothetical protein
VTLSNICEPPDSWQSLFFLEALGVVAFGISWLVKFGILGLLADRVSTASSASPQTGDISHDVVRVRVVEHADPRVSAGSDADD